MHELPLLMVLSGLYYVEGGRVYAVGQEVDFWNRQTGINEQAASSLIVRDSQIIFSNEYRKKRGFSVR